MIYYILYRKKKGMIRLRGQAARIGEKEKELYFKVFVTAFLIMAAMFIPSMLYNKGIFLYYGDFNSQQIPFYTHAHEMVRNGNIFWDWGTDLGANFIGSYSFYLLGSPFFWLTIPFPTAAVPYLVPWLLALKTGVAGLTAYMYIRRFVASKNACFIGAILYALSGFQIYNVFFNHFHEAVAFFPLLLIALEENVINGRRGVFALAVALCAGTNYFFFTGEIVFLIIYFMCRSTSKDFTINFTKFVHLAVESVLGVLLSAAILIPSVITTLSNPRVDTQLVGLDMVVYNDKFRIFRIIQSFFMIPDPPARSNLFSSSTARWASIAGYLPMFSMAGVIAFIKGKSKHWSSKVVVACLIFALVPVLNSAFYLFNSSYYARWYFMPVLLMCMMTAYVLDHKKLNFKGGLKFCGIALVVIAVIGILPTNSKDGNVVYGKVTEYPMLFWLSVAITAMGLIFVYLIEHMKPRKDMRKEPISRQLIADVMDMENGAKDYFKIVKKLTIIATVCCTALIVWYGMAQGPYQDRYINRAINGAENYTLEETDNFYRVDISENVDNFPMFWGESSMRAFHSVVPSSIMNFYSGIGINRDVASRVEIARYPLRGLLSVKYYFNEKEKDDIYIPGFEYISTQNDFDIYENKYFIPMGFTFDYYIPKAEFDKINNSSDKDIVLLKALVLSPEQVRLYSNVLTPLSESEQLGFYGEGEYFNVCEIKRENSAYYFEEDTRGFTAKINLESPKMVFFSVPYEEGFTATVNGKQAVIEEVDGGMMAVLCPAGNEVTIRFNYMTPGLKIGITVTITTVILLAAYVVVMRRISPSAKKMPIEYDYESLDLAIENGEYDKVEEKEEATDESEASEGESFEKAEDES